MGALDVVSLLSSPCGSDVNRKHWAKSGVVAFDDKDSANTFYVAATQKHDHCRITTWMLGRLYIVCLIPRYAEALERSGFRQSAERLNATRHYLTPRW